MRVIKKGTSDQSKKVDFTCPHCESLLRAKMSELTPYGITDEFGLTRKLHFYCPVCHARRVIDRYKVFYHKTITDHVNDFMSELIRTEVLDPNFEEEVYESC